MRRGALATFSFVQQGPSRALVQSTAQAPAVPTAPPPAFVGRVRGLFSAEQDQAGPAAEEAAWPPQPSRRPGTCGTRNGGLAAAPDPLPPAAGWPASPAMSWNTRSGRPTNGPAPFSTRPVCRPPLVRGLPWRPFSTSKPPDDDGDGDEHGRLFRRGGAAVPVEPALPAPTPALTPARHETPRPVVLRSTKVQKDEPVVPLAVDDPPMDAAPPPAAAAYDSGTDGKAVATAGDNTHGWYVDFASWRNRTSAPAPTPLPPPPADPIKAPPRTDAAIRVRHLDPPPPPPEDAEEPDMMGDPLALDVYEIGRSCEITRHTYQNPRMLGLAARDVALFDTSTSFSRHRSSIVARDRSVLVRLVSGSLQAMIRSDRTLIFDASKDLRSRVADAIVDRLRAPSPLPYELRLLEALLAEAHSRFQRKLRWLAPLVDRVLEDLTEEAGPNGEISAKLFRKLLPLKRTLNDTESDVREAYEAIDEVILDEATVESVCLSAAAEEPLLLPQHRQAAADLLDSYSRQIRAIGEELKAMSFNIDNTREMWEVGLDAARNRIITFNMYVSMASLAVGAASLPGTMFGMNLVSGWEDPASSAAFWNLVTYSSACSAGLFLGLVYYMHAYPRHAQHARLQDVAVVSDLVGTLPRLEETLEEVAQKWPKGVKRSAFVKLVQSRMPAGRPMTTAEVDLLVKVFDPDGDGVLRISMGNRRHDRHTPPARAQRYPEFLG